MRPVIFSVVTFFLAGFSCAVLWRRVTGADEQRPALDCFVWVAGSPFLIVGVYYLALWALPGRSSHLCIGVITGLWVLLLAVQPKHTVATTRVLLEDAWALVRRHVLMPSTAARRLCFCCAAMLAAVWSRPVTMAMHHPYWEHDALEYAARGWDWHAAHSLDWWSPTSPSDRGFVQFIAHSPGFELLNAWAADWMPERFVDITMRLNALGSFAACALLLVVLTSRASPWGPWLGVGLFAAGRDLAQQVAEHSRDPFRLLGALLFFAALVHVWKRPTRYTVVAVALAGAAALAGHTLGIVVIGTTALAWTLGHRKDWRKCLVAFGLGVPLAVGIGGKQYVKNLVSTGNIRGGITSADTALEGTDVDWEQLQQAPHLPRAGLRDLPQKLALFVDLDAAYAVPLAVGALAVALALGCGHPRAPDDSPRALGVVGLIIALHVAMVAGALDMLYSDLSINFARNPRYILQVLPFAAVALPYALDRLQGRTPTMRALCAVSVLCIGLGLVHVWRNTLFARVRGVFPYFPPTLSVYPWQDPYVILRIEQAIGDNLVLEVNVPEILYYTDCRGRSFTDPILRPVYAAAGDPAKQRDLLLGLGLRYIVAPSHMDAYLDALGYAQLFATPAVCRLVEEGEYAVSKRLYLYELLPPQP